MHRPVQLSGEDQTMGEPAVRCYYCLAVLGNYSTRCLSREGSERVFEIYTMSHQVHCQTKSFAGEKNHKNALKRVYLQTMNVTRNSEETLHVQTSYMMFVSGTHSAVGSLETARNAVSFSSFFFNPPPLPPLPHQQ